MDQKKFKQFLQSHFTNANYIHESSETSIHGNWKNFERHPNRAIRIWSASSSSKINGSRANAKLSSYNPTPKTFIYGLNKEDEEPLMSLFFEDPATPSSIKSSKAVKALKRQLVRLNRSKTKIKANIEAAKE